VETLTAVDRDILEGSFLNEGRKAVRIIDAQAAEIERLKRALEAEDYAQRDFDEFNTDHPTEDERGA
jgi:hypothetical protein